MSVHRRPLVLALFVMVGTVGLTGCAARYELKVPGSFVELDEPGAGYDLRATDAHGVVLAVRAMDNDPKGNLAFWTDAVTNRVRTLGGYALLDTKDVRAASGQKGKQLRFGHDENGTAYAYWVTVFVTEGRIFVVEAGGRRDRFEAVQEPVEKAIAGIRVD